MGMTITEKILCAHAECKELHPGMLINAKVDIALGNDVTAPMAIEEFRKAGGDKVFDRGKVVFTADHFVPNKDIASARQCKIMRAFAKEQGLIYYYEGGAVGIEHALLPEQGIVQICRALRHIPGMLVGADAFGRGILIAGFGGLVLLARLGEFILDWLHFSSLRVGDLHLLLESLLAKDELLDGVHLFTRGLRL